MFIINFNRMSIYVYYYFVEPKLYLTMYQTMNGWRKAQQLMVNLEVMMHFIFIFCRLCPHCCKLKEQEFYNTWFKEDGDMNSRQWGDYNLHIREFNPEKDLYDDDKNYTSSSSEMQKMIKEYKPDGYPSVVLFNADGKKVELDAKINDESLRAFLKVKLGKLQE